ncbi:MAG: cyclic nucleotide-binding domain-containing protein [Cyanobacteria bacterium J06626_18]
MERVLFILGLLEDEDVDWLVGAGRRREIARNEVLIQEGVLNTAIYLILSGRFVVAVARSPHTEIAHMSSGEVVGEMSFVDHLPSSATVKASEPAVVLEIDREILNQKLAQDVSFARRWYHALAILLSTRLRGTVRYLEAEFWKPFTLEETHFSPDMADSMELGGIRFDWLMRRLRDTDIQPHKT